MIKFKKSWIYIFIRNIYWRYIVRNIRKIYPSYRLRGTGNSNSARYCYAVFMRHLVTIWKCGLFRIGGTLPHSAAEFGPGESLGVGLCAMLAGVNEYYAFDVIEHVDKRINLALFDELVTMFQEKSSIPDAQEFPGIHIFLDDYSFPEVILPDTLLKSTLDPERIQGIRSLLENNDTNVCTYHTTSLVIKYIVPWDNYCDSYPLVDWVYSQSVLEHINDLSQFYMVMKRMIKDGGISSHNIDFRSHDQTYAWNGHWAIPDKKWDKICENQMYLINREPLSTHLHLFKQHGFLVIKENRFSGKDEVNPSILRKKLTGKFRNLSDEDFTTSTCFIVAQRLKTNQDYAYENTSNR